jgi:hypothetical protein
MRLFFAAAMMVAGLGSPAPAQPRFEQQVPADARWLAHLDLNAAKAGEVTQTVSNLWLRNPKIAQGARWFALTTGTDPLAHVQSILVFGRSYEQNAAVVVIRARLAPRRLMQFFARRDDYQTTPHRGHTVLGWTEKKGEPDEHSMFACIHGPGLVVLGRDREQVRRTLDVLDGKASKLSAKDPLYAPASPDGTVIELRGVGFADVTLPFASPLVRKSQYLMAIGGERDGQAFVNVEVRSDTEPVAQQLRAVVDGLMAMARLRFDQNEELLRLLNSVKVSQVEKTVLVQCRWPAEKLSMLLKRAWKIQQSRS